jgi:GTP-binding protein
MDNIRVPIIAIVGKPNVGKSSLFNRLINKRLAITSEIAGTTRDRIYHHTNFGHFSAILVDTGGMEYGKKENIEGDIQTQIELAINEADIIFFVIDAKEELTLNDYEAAKKLRRSKDKIIFIANKIDTKISESNINETLKLGFGEPVRISAYHNMGIDELVNIIIKKFKDLGFKPVKSLQKPQNVINISFVGKPNVGKSSLINAIFGKEKVIVSEIPGTTRDATDTEIEYNGRKFNLIDTAGLRRRGRIERGLEKISSFRALSAIEKSDIVCLVLDYGTGIQKQDQHIASYILEAGKGLILVVNKCDLMEDRQSDEKKLVRSLRQKFEFLPWAPAIFVSALKRSNILNIFSLVSNIYAERFKKIGDKELAEFLKETVFKHMPSQTGRNRVRFSDLKQVSVNPPVFAYQVDNPKSVHFSYKRYLENELRKKYGFIGTSIKIIFKKSIY